MINLPQPVQLEQDPYARSRTGFDSYLGFLRDQKDRATAARNLNIQKSLLAEQKIDKMAEMEAEYGFKLRNDLITQGLSGQQAKERLEMELGFKQEKAAADAEIAAITAERLDREKFLDAVKTTRTETDKTQKELLDEYGNLTRMYNIDYTVDFDVDPFTKIPNIFVRRGEQVQTLQEFRALLNNFKDIADFVDVYEKTALGDKRPETVNEDGYITIGTDLEGQKIISAMKNPNDPMHGTYVDMYKAGRLLGGAKPGTTEKRVREFTDEYHKAEMELGAAITVSGIGDNGNWKIEHGLGLNSLPWSSTTIDFNLPLSQVMEQLKEVRQWAESGYVEKINAVLSTMETLVYQYKKSKNPDNPEAMDDNDFRYNTKTRRLEVVPKSSVGTTVAPRTSGIQNLGNQGINAGIR
jgi:hypothetical protein